MSKEPEFKWQTRDGKWLALSEMTLEHLQNTARYLRRRAEEEHSSYWQVASFVTGEQALYELDGQMGEVMETYARRVGAARLMDEEVARRSCKMGAAK